MESQDGTAEKHALKKLPLPDLQFRPSPDSWNVPECVEHLIRYGDFYIPVIQRSLSKSRDDNDPFVKSGFPGEKFANMMLPKPRMKKIRAFKNMDPNGSAPGPSVIDTLRGPSEMILRVLGDALYKDLTKAKTPVSISRLIKLRLGDTLRVVIYHNDCHIAQARRIIEASEHRQAFT